MQASGRAALRELDRLINAHRTVRVEWLPGRPVTLDAPARDICYLLDGSRDLSREAPQLEGHVPFENGLPVAIADAIYAHAFPSSGAVFSRDYPNLLPHLIAGTEARYSSFGSYSVNYAWEPLTRSAGMRAAVDVLDQLLARAGERGRQGARPVPRRRRHRVPRRRRRSAAAAGVPDRRAPEARCLHSLLHWWPFELP